MSEPPEVFRARAIATNDELLKERGELLTTIANLQKRNRQLDNQPKSLISVMAEKYSMEPKAFADAVRKTAMPSTASNEEFAAFMMVAKEYNLNPLLKEIHAFPKKGGGIQPVVSIDGWVSLINQHPDNNGFDFETHLDDEGKLVAVTCRMFRKTREHPVEVTEYLEECYRNTDAWKMPNRMLRHKALIQAARYCFGFSGIMEEDEAERIPMRDITPERPKMAQFIKPLKSPEDSAGDEKKLEAKDVRRNDGKAPQDPREFDNAGERLPDLTAPGNDSPKLV